MTDNRTPIQHGEILLVPIDKSEIPENAKRKLKGRSYIVGHSETGHHHVLEADTEFEVFTVEDEAFLMLVESGTLTHKKDFDFHPNLPVDSGAYKVVNKTEYDAVSQTLQRVMD